MGARNRKSKPAKEPYRPLRPSEIPLAHPSTAGAGAAPTAPLVQLSEADLRAAGVSFHSSDGAGVSNIGGRSATDWMAELEGKEGIKVQGGARTGAAAAPIAGENGELQEEGGNEEDYDDEYDDEAEEEARRDAEVEAFWDEFFDALMWTVPFSFLYLMLDILTNLSYSRHPSFGHYMKNYAFSTPTLGIIVFFTTRHAKLRWMRALVTVASIGSGCRLIWLVNKASYLRVIDQAPAMGTLWILTIVQLPLPLAVGALACVAGWLKYAKMKLIP